MNIKKLSIFFILQLLSAQIAYAAIEDIVEETQKITDRRVFSNLLFNASSVGTLNIPDESHKEVLSRKLNIENTSEHTIHICAEEQTRQPTIEAEIVKIYSDKTTLSSYGLRTKSFTGQWIEISQKSSLTAIAVTITTGGKTSTSIIRTNINGCTELDFNNITNQDTDTVQEKNGQKRVDLILQAIEYPESKAISLAIPNEFKKKTPSNK